MKDITVEDIIKICNAELICGEKDTKCINFEKDTRLIKNGDVFIGIKGDNFDGNTMYKEALENGANVCIVSGINPQIVNNKTILRVEDSVKALQQIAEYKRKLYNIPVIAVTGSVGKTSTKDIIASVMSKKYKVLKTEGNMNNHIGLPLTILKLKDHEALVTEMGMNHFGEIRVLTNIAHPTMCVISNIGTSHIGNLGSRENILKAKLEILEGTNADSPIIINNDNDLLNEWAKKVKTTHKIVTFGIDNKSNINATDIKSFEDKSIFNIEIDGKKYEVKVPVGGKHFIYNALSAICIALENGIEIKEAIKGIEEFELTKKRMEVIKSKQSGATIINDTYNASYDSVKAALEYLNNINGKRKVAILGDMLELGEFSKEMHEKVGKEVVNNKVNILITVGEEAKNIVKEVKKSKNNIEIHECNSNQEAINIAKEILSDNDLVLVKASNGMHFDTIVSNIV